MTEGVQPAVVEEERVASGCSGKRNSDGVCQLLDWGQSISGNRSARSERYIWF